MDTTFYAAIVAASITLIAAWMTAFVAEDYRRFRTGKALAAALEGELSSYRSAFDVGKKAFTSILETLEKGVDVPMPKIETPVDYVFDSSVGDLGFLGSKLAGQVPFVYHQIKAFRTTFLSMRKAPDIAHKITSIKVCLQFLENAETHGRPLAVELKRRSTMSYRPFMS